VQVKNMKHEKSCGAVILSKTGGDFKVLLIQHRNGGHWSFPKGHVEKDENEVDTALREIKEETGIDAVIDTGFRHVTTYSPDQDIMKDVVYFIAKPKDEKLLLQAEEVRNAGWYSFDKASQIITFENDKKLFESAVDYIKSSRFFD
jgi:8-oxo-dGTP pyrophosphatase MutT (NUDIX family)